MNIKDYAHSKNKFFFYALFFTYLFILLSLRKPDSIFNAQFFAEDGTWFRIAYQNNYNIFKKSAGYCHLIPRAVALFANCFSTCYSPIIYNIVAMIIATMCCFWITLPQNEKIIKRIEIRMLISVLIILMPTAHEVLCNITNVQWYLNIWGALFCVTKLPKRRIFRVGLCVFYSACVLSSPTFIIFVPILLLRVIIEKDNRGEIIALITISILYSTTIVFISNTSEIESNSYQSIINIIKNYTHYICARSLPTVSLFYNLKECNLENSNIYIFSILTNSITTLTISYFILKNKSKLNVKFIIYFLYISFSSVAIFILLRVNLNPKEFLQLAYDFSYASRYSVLMCAVNYILIGIIIEHLVNMRFLKTSFTIISILLSNCIINFNFTIQFKDYNWSYWSKILDNNKHTISIYNDIPINPEGWYIRKKINEDFKQEN